MRRLDRFHFFLGFVLLLGLLFCARASKADGSFAIGVIGVHSSGLGFESPYGGAQAIGSIEGERLLCRGDFAALDARKDHDYGDGRQYGLRATALCGVKLGAFDVLGGASWARQHTDAYEKDATEPRLELGLTLRGGRLSVSYSAADSNDDTERAYGLRCETSTRLAVVGEWQHVELAERYGGGEGDVVSLSVLWRLR